MDRRASHEASRRHEAGTPEPETGEDGFTLVELLVVLAIIAMLATLIGPKVLGYLGSARADTAAFQMRNIANAVELYYLGTGSYPPTQSGLSALVSAPSETAGWNGPYLQSATALTDPWGRPYLYKMNGTSFSIGSLGRDGMEGGSGEDADITVGQAS